MKHLFDVEIAKQYGVNPAILLENLGYWIKQNEANEVNFYDGNYWTFNSRRAYRELFPYMSERQIDTAFRKLIDDGLVVTGNYNKVAYDRTLWYALTQKGKSILHFDGMETYKMSNGNPQNVKPIPNINTNNKTNINTEEEKKEKISYNEIMDMFNTICRSYPRLTVLSDKRKQAIKARLNTYSIEQFEEMFINAENSSFLKGNNNRNWMANFDWLMKDGNFAKVLDGNYNDTATSYAPKQQQQTGNPFLDMLQEEYEKGTF